MNKEETDTWKSGAYAFFANTLSGPKIGSPNLLAILDVGPIYLAILYFFN